MQDDLDKSEMTLLHETTAIRSAALVVTNLLFIVEFQFDTGKIIHLSALSLFSLSTPLLSFIVLAANFWKSGYKFENSIKNYHFGPIHNLGASLSIIAIGLCLFSYHWIPGLIFTAGCLYASRTFAELAGYNFNKRKEDSGTTNN